MEECVQLHVENRKEKASFFSKLCFLWTTDCVSKCTNREMKLEQMSKCPDSHSSSRNGNHLEELWKEELKACNEKNIKPGLLWTLINAFYIDYLPMAVTALLNYVIIKGLQPLILSNLIKLFISKNYTIPAIFAYGGGLSLLMMCSSFLLHHTVCGSNLLAIKIRVALSSLVYRKVLKLNQQSLSSTSSGHVINLLSNDVGKFENAVQAFHFLWLTPIQLAVIIFVIWNLFGLGALFGITTLILILIPFQGFLGHLTGVYRKEAAEITDKRVKIMNEVFSGMGAIKMYTWEHCFQNLIENVRKQELRYIRRIAFIKGILACMMFMTEKLGLCITVVCYSLIGFPVSTDVVFSVSVCFRILQYSLGTMLPSAITIGSEVLVSIGRLEEFLSLDEIEAEAQTGEENKDKGGIYLNGVSANWKEKEIALDNIRISISPGSLCCIYGPFGSGKSSLLKLFLGEMVASKGNMKINGKISFSSQKPWLFSSTIRRNILFSEEFNETRYREVVQVCGLTKEFEQFPDGDQTLVGNKGVTLSGGQRARISLARTVYKEADIYLLDDILSALDSKVGKFVFDECILKFLKGKTTVLVAYQMQFLKDVEHIIMLEKGYVADQGNFSKIFRTKLDDFLEKEDYDKNSHKRSLSAAEEKQFSPEGTMSEEKYSTKFNDEDIFRGSVLWKYIKLSSNYFNIAVLFLLLLISQLSLNLSDYWITIWSEQEHIRYSISSEKTPPSFNRNLTDTSRFERRKELTILQSLNNDTISWSTDTVIINEVPFHLVKTKIMRIIYIVIIFLALSFMLFRSFLFFHLCLKASRRLHSEMLSGLVAAPMKFFHKNPPGNILNRFSKDMGAADELFPKALLNVLASVPILLGSMFLIMISNIFMVTLIIPLILMLLKMRKWFLITVKTLRRLETAEKSPVFSFMTSTLDGVTTIRSFQCSKLLIEQFDRYQDVHTACSHLAISCTSAFGLWLDLLCVLFLYAVITLFILLDQYFTVSGSFIGLAIFHSMTIVGLFQFCIRTISETVNYSTNIERLLSYTQLDREEDTKCNGIVTEQFEDINKRFQPSSPLAI